MATNSANWMRYGPIKLNIVKLLEYKKEPVYSDREKTHYMFTRHTFAVGATVYPDTDIDFTQIPEQLVATLAGCYTNEPSDSENLTKPNTVNEQQSVVRIETLLRHFLMQPRQKFKYIVGDDVLLEVPTIDSLTDCNNGPKPVSLNIKRITGLQSMYVEYVISTDLNESIRYGSPEYPILSNHYSMEHEINQDFYTTRKVSGVAHFRSDLLYRDNLSPDDFREWLNIPSPKGFKRDVVRCRVHPDALKMEYSFVDREVHHHLDTRPPDKKDKIKINGNLTDAPDLRNITRLEVKQSLSMQHESIAGALGKASRSGFETLTAKPGSKFSAGLGGVFDLTASLFPMKNEVVDIVIYGNNISEKHEMEYIALFIVEKRLPFNTMSGLYSFSIEEDVLGSHIRMRVSRASSPLDSVAAIGTNTTNTLNNIVVKPSILKKGGLFDLNTIKSKKQTFFSDSQGIEGVTIKTFLNGKINPALQEVPAIKAREGEFDQMRGTYLEQLVSEGIRITPEEFPLDDKSKPFYDYRSDNEFERKLPIDKPKN